MLIYCTFFPLHRDSDKNSLFISSLYSPFPTFKQKWPTLKITGTYYKIFPLTGLRFADVHVLKLFHIQVFNKKKLLPSNHCPDILNRYRNRQIMEFLKKFWLFSNCIFETYFTIKLKFLKYNLYKQGIILVLNLCLWSTLIKVYALLSLVIVWYYTIVHQHKFLPIFYIFHRLDSPFVSILIWHRSHNARIFSVYPNK